MRYFKKLTNLPVVILPTGRVFDHDILEGAEYAQYVPMYLYEVDSKGYALSARTTVASPVEPQPVSKVEVTHVTYPPRPAPPPELAKAWEARRPTPVTTGLQSMEDALALALKQTVPLPEEAPAESPTPTNTATMEASAPPKRKPGRPKKVKAEPPPVKGA